MYIVIKFLQQDLTYDLIFDEKIENIIFLIEIFLYNIWKIEL